MWIQIRNRLIQTNFIYQVIVRPSPKNSDPPVWWEVVIERLEKNDLLFGYGPNDEEIRSRYWEREEDLKRLSDKYKAKAESLKTFVLQNTSAQIIFPKFDE